MAKGSAHGQRTPRASAEQQLAVQYAVAQILAEAPSLQDATAQFLEAICAGLGYDWGCLWQVDQDAGVARYVQSWHPPTLAATKLEQVSRRLAFHRNVGMVGRVWATGKPVYIPDVAADPTFRRTTAAVKLGFRAALGIPVRLGRTLLGVMEFLSTEIRPPGDELLAFLEVIGSQIGQFGKRTRLEEERASLLAREQAARAAAQANEAGLYAVLDQMPEGVVLYDARGRRRFYNQAARALSVGETGQVDLYGNPIIHDIRLPSGEPLPVADLPIMRTIERGEVVQGREVLLRQRDGRLVATRGSSAPVYGPRGERLGTVGVFQDISALKALEREREEWISIITHDLRQPVTIILGYAGRLTSRLAGHASPDETKAIDYVLTAAQNLNQMIGDLLDVSRLETRRLALQPREVDLPALVQAAVDRARSVTLGHPVRVAIVGEIPPLAADPGRVEQVLDNLLSNAAKYSDAESEITVEVARREEGVAVAVTNRGPGIGFEELPRLFTRFYRTREAQAGRAAGLGLGLYISKGLVEAHGGKIWAESVPGQTTTFHFTLPLHA